jgi:hypothetical protein
LLLAFVALAVYVLGSVLSVKTEPRRSRRCPAPRSGARRRSPPGDDAVEVRMTLDQPLVAGSWMRIVAFNPGGDASGRDQLVGGP